MKKSILFVILLSVLAVHVQAQIKIGDNPTVIHGRSVLELESTDKALYLPRLTNTERDAQTDWQTGMMIYNTSDSCVQSFNGIVWNCLENAEVEADTTNDFFVTVPRIAGTYNTVDTTSVSVGIGTSTPLAKFEVVTENSQDVIFGRYLDGGASQSNDMDIDLVRAYGSYASPSVVSDSATRIGGVRFRTLVNTDPLVFITNPLNAVAPIAEVASETDGVPTTTSAPGKILFRTTPANALRPQTAMVVNSKGNVGIGEDVPDEKLVVGGKTRVEDLTGPANADYDDVLVADPISGELKRSLSDSARLFVRSDGRLLFGDTLDTKNGRGGFVNFRRRSGAANLKLQARQGLAVMWMEGYKDGADAAILRFVSGRGTETAQEVLQDGDRLGQMQWYGYTNTGFGEGVSFGAAQRVEADGPVTSGSNRIKTRMSFHTSDGSALPIRRMVIDGDGNIGIGTGVNVNHPLEMSSGAHVTSAGVWTDASDARLKDNINPASYGLDEVLQLRPVTYVMKNDPEKAPQLGFIAQEVQKIIPEVVSGSEGDLEEGQTLGLAYSHLVPVMVRAMQEQQKMLEEEREKNKALQTKLADLEREMSLIRELVEQK